MKNKCTLRAAVFAPGLPATATARCTVADVTLAALLTWLLADWAPQFPGGLIRDDGFFYSQIAYNIALHGQSSFDMINHTDGYHQLWGLILAGMSWIFSWFSAEKSVHLLAYIFLNLFIIVAAARVAGLGQLAAVGFIGLLVSNSLLMEGHLLLLLGLVAARSLDRSTTRVRPELLIALALIPFCRIDAILVGLFILVAIFLTRPRPFFVKASLALAAGVAIHFLYLRLVHGTFFTVSSLLKADSDLAPFARLVSNMFRLNELGGLSLPLDPMFTIFVTLNLGAVVVLALSPRLRGRYGLIALWLGAGAFTTGHAFFNVLRPWYYTLTFGAAAVLVLLWLQQLRRPMLRRTLLITTCITMLLPVVGLGYLGWKYRTEAHDVRAFIDGIPRFVPAVAPIFMVDGSGYIGWRASHSIVNGDGLVNSHAYARRGLAGELAGYLEENDIEFLITSTPKDDPWVLIDKFGLVVKRNEAILLLEKPGIVRYYYTDLKLWRLQTQ